MRRDRYRAIVRSTTYLGAAAVLAAGTATALPAPEANANWWGATGKHGTCVGGNRSDAAPLTYTYVDLAQAMDDATDWVRANDIQPAGLPTTYDATPPSTIDVYVLDRQYDNYCDQPWATSGTSGGTVGFTTCNSIDSVDRCQSADVRYNNNWTFDVGTSNERSLACHENGHAIGLKHPDPDIASEMFGQGCMTFGSGETGFTSHDRPHINSNY